MINCWIQKGIFRHPYSGSVDAQVWTTELSWNIYIFPVNTYIGLPCVVFQGKIVQRETMPVYQRNGGKTRDCWTFLCVRPYEIVYLRLAFLSVSLNVWNALFAIRWYYKLIIMNAFKWLSTEARSRGSKTRGTSSRPWGCLFRWSGKPLHREQSDCHIAWTKLIRPNHAGGRFRGHREVQVWMPLLP